jgi:hypothetical protein
MIKKNLKMDVRARQRLASIPRTRCAKCKSFRSYQNPVARCFECGKKFCFQDIYPVQVNDTMKDTDEARNICDACKEEFGYIDLGEYYRVKNTPKIGV